jgi:hypothetical protein
LSTLQGSPQKHIDTGTPVGKGSGSKAVPVKGPFLNFDKIYNNHKYNRLIKYDLIQCLPLFSSFTIPRHPTILIYLVSKNRNKHKKQTAEGVIYRCIPLRQDLRRRGTRHVSSTVAPRLTYARQKFGADTHNLGAELRVHFLGPFFEMKLQMI